MKMTQRCIGICSVGLFAVSGFVSQDRGSNTVPASEIAEHAVCRALFAADGTAEVVCYLAFVEGISGSLFSGIPSEATAFFTLRTDRISAQPITNGNIIVFLQSAGRYDVYFNSSPHGDWNNPDSFSSGELVATFTRTPPLFVNVGTMGNGFFSAKLTGSQEFVFSGQTVDFKRLVPHGVTWIVTASATPIAGPSGFVGAQAFAGSALAIGGKVSTLGPSTK